MKKVKVLITAAMTLLLCGCSHKTEVRDKGFIKEIGCDSGDIQSVAVRLYGDEKTVLDGSGETIYSAIESAETSQGKTFFSGHLDLILLNTGDVQDKLTVMIKNNRISPSCALVIAPDGAVKAVHNDENLSDILESSSRKGKVVRKNISEVLNDLLEEDSMAAVPVLKDGILSMCVTNGKEISGILSEDESEGFCWLNGDLNDIYLPIEVNGKKSSFLVRSSSTRLTADTEENGIKLTAEIKINGSCSDEGISESDASKAAARKISALCSKTISKTVTGMNADVLGIKKCIDSQNISKGRAWSEIIPDLKFYYSIKIAS